MIQEFRACRHPLEYFPDFSVHTDHLGILLKCRFRCSISGSLRSVYSLRVCIFNKFPGDANASFPLTCLVTQDKLPGKASCDRKPRCCGRPWFPVVEDNHCLSFLRDLFLPPAVWEPVGRFHVFTQAFIAPLCRPPDPVTLACAWETHKSIHDSTITASY